MNYSSLFIEYLSKQYREPASGLIATRDSFRDCLDFPMFKFAHSTDSEVLKRAASCMVNAESDDKYLCNTIKQIDSTRLASRLLTQIEIALRKVDRMTNNLHPSRLPILTHTLRWKGTDECVYNVYRGPNDSLETEDGTKSIVWSKAAVGPLARGYVAGTLLRLVWVDKLLEYNANATSES